MSNQSLKNLAWGKDKGGRVGGSNSLLLATCLLATSTSLSKPPLVPHARLKYNCIIPSPPVIRSDSERATKSGQAKVMQLTFVGSVGSVGRWFLGAWVGHAALA